MTKGTYLKLQIFLFSTLLASLLLFSSTASADVGAKPEMTFEFVYETPEPLTIVSGEQWQCDQASCSNPQVLEDAGPQGFRCAAGTCNSTAYGYSDYNRLVIEFSDGVTRESNIFETRSFNNQYRVTVRQNDLQVERIGGSNPGRRLLVSVLLGLGCLLLLVAGLVAGLFALIRRRRATAG